MMIHNVNTDMRFCKGGNGRIATGAVLLGCVIFILAAPLQVATAASSSTEGSVAGSVTVTKKGRSIDRSGIVVYLEGVPGRPAKMRAEIGQRNKQFEPELTVVTKGSTIEFPNHDRIFHNVFSVSRTARFDLGLYKSGSSKSVKLRRAGVVDLYCNIHPQMVAKLMVLNTGYYAVTGPDGKFRIDGVPAGTYPIIAWQAYGTQFDGTAVVRAGGVTTINVTLKRGKKKRNHLRKDGTPYGRYK